VRCADTQARGIDPLSFAGKFKSPGSCVGVPFSDCHEILDWCFGSGYSSAVRNQAQRQLAAGEGEIKVRLIKMFGLAAVAAVAAMAFVGATSASATSTALCTSHPGLECGLTEAQLLTLKHLQEAMSEPVTTPNPLVENHVTSVHQVLKTGTVGRLLAAINVLCLGFLVEADALGLGNPQEVHSLSQSFTGCGTGSAHNNCTVSIPTGQQPLFDLLKIGLDQGILTALSGQTRLECPNLGLNCLYDVAGMEFEVGGNELKAENTPTTELGGKFFCPDEGLLDAELTTLTNAFVLG
jgi:hypothetical protein